MLGPAILNGINFFTLPIFTRMLTTEQFGVVTTYTLGVSVVTVLVGLQTQGTIGTAFSHFEEDEKKGYISSIVTIALLSFVLLFGLALLFLNPLAQFIGIARNYVILMFLQALGAFGVSFASMKFTFCKQAVKNFLLSVAVGALTAILSIIFIQMDSGPELYRGRLYGLALPNIFAGVALLAFFLVAGRRFFVKKYWRFCLPLAAPLIFHGLSHILLAQSARFVIQKQLGFSEAGIYGFVFTVTQVLNILYAALNNAWVPFYYDDLKNRRFDVINKKTANYIFLFAGLTVGFILVSREFLQIFAGADYLTGTPTLPLMAASIFCTFLYSFPVNFQFYHRNTVAIAIGTTFSALINLGLAIWLTPIYGIMGTAVALLISYVLLFVFHHIIASFILKRFYHYKLRQFLPGIGAVAAAVISFYLLENMWYIRWGAAVLVGGALVWKLVKNRSIF